MDELRAQVGRVQKALTDPDTGLLAREAELIAETKKLRTNLKVAVIAFLVVIAVVCIVGAIWISSATNASHKSKEASDTANAAIRSVNGSVRCIERWADQFTSRSRVLTALGKEIRHADRKARHWAHIQNVIFQQALLHPPSARTKAAVQHRYLHATSRYLHWDSVWRDLNKKYDRYTASHPLPDLHRLNCERELHLTPTPTTTVTATATATETATHFVPVPGAAATTTRTRVEHVPVPGPTTTVFRPPGKGRGTVTVSVTVTASPTCSVVVAGMCVSP